MHTVMESLLELIQADPLPAEHTSSHWQRYGRETVVEERDGLVLQAAGFSSAVKPSLPWRLCDVVERWWYVPVTRQLDRYPAVQVEAKRLRHALQRGVTQPTQMPRRFWAAARLSHERIFTTAIAVLAGHLMEYGLAPRTFAVIGDGDGFFGALARRCFPGIKLYCIDLPKMLAFQASTHEKASPGVTMSVGAGGHAADVEVTLVPPQDIEGIQGPIDCAVNISSLQEMNAFSVNRYFTFLRQRTSARSRFYCVNLARKALIGGEVTVFAEYPWQGDDEIFVDGPCPYFTHYVAPFTLSYGPRWLNMRVPFVNAFGETVMHRVVRLAPPAPR